MRNWIILLSAFFVLMSCGDDGSETILNLGPCDSGFTVDDANVFSASAALDMCQRSGPENLVGLVYARYVRADGSSAAASAQFGIQEQFGAGISARLGDAMLALSTGTARTPAQSGYCGTSCSGYGSGTPPPGLPQGTGSCPGSSDISDDVGLEVRLIAPADARGFRVDYLFLTLDNAFPCSPFNDQFVIVMDPAPAGSVSGNIALDGFADPINVNSDFVPGDAGLLSGNGYDGGATTGWLRTTAPVNGGQTITLRLLIWDSGDDANNSTVLIDNFQWLDESVSVNTTAL